MKKRDYVTGKELTDKQWEQIAPLLPEPIQSSKGGQKRAPNRACLEGILWICRTGARWCDMPERYPSGSTCWRRMNEWQEQDLWTDIWHKLLGTLDARGRLNWDEVFADGTFASAKKGEPESVKQSAGKEQSLWWWQMVRAYLSGLSLLPQRPMRLN